MENKTRDILLQTKARLSNDIIAIENAVGIVDARTVTLPLISAFSAINRIMRADVPVKQANLAQRDGQVDSGMVGEGNHPEKLAHGS